MQLETLRLFGYAAMMTFGVLLLGGLAWREYDRRMDRVLMLDPETKEPKVRRLIVHDGTFKWKRKGMGPLLVSVPDKAPNTVWHRRGAASVIIINQKGDVLAYDPGTDVKAGADRMGAALRIYDAAHYYVLSKTEMVKKAIQAYDTKQGMDKTMLILGLLLVVAVGAGAYFIGKGG